MAKLWTRGKARESETFECAAASDWLDLVITTMGDGGLISPPAVEPILELARDGLVDTTRSA
jgi:hypothetical protein